MANKIWMRKNDDSCPSCVALHGQVHSEEDWGDLKPGSDRLYCTEHCHCELIDTNEPATGEIEDAPLRRLQAEKERDMGNATDFRMELSATASDDGFDILAISEGEAKGHGITFSGAVLQEALPLYDGIPVFVDHVGPGEPQSVRNLAGTLHSPAWSDRERGIQLKLKPGGPASDVLMALREAAKKDPAIMKAVGFSSVVNVQLNAQRQVTKIVRVKSTDAVVDPARGGKFLQSLYSNQEGENEMPVEKKNDVAPDAAQQLKELQAQLVSQSGDLLETALSASKLPVASQKAVRKPFDKMLAEGKSFTNAELQEAITEKRAELSELGGNNIQGPGRVTNMVNSEDQFRIALDDLFGVEREEGQKGVRVHRLSGIREAYLMATGDQEFMGGYHPEFALVTANFPGLVANVQNKILMKAWDNLLPVYGWWEKIVTVEHFSNLNDISWIKTGTIASLPTVLERGEYTELVIGDNKETDSFVKYGGYIPLTLEAVLRDDLRAFRQMPKELALSGMRNISEKVAEIFTQASGAGPTLADGGALFNSTAVTTAGGHANLLTTALGTDFTAWDAVATAVYEQPLLVSDSSLGTGKKMAIEPRYILVPRALKAQAEALFIPRWAGSVEAIASSGGPTYGGLVEPITVPEWTDDTDFAAVVDPRLVPGVMIGEIFGVKPQIFSASSEIDPAMFANDESRIKVRQFLAVGVADFRPLHKSNVAG